MDWFQITLTAGTALFSAIGGAVYGARQARSSERIADAASQAARTDARRADAEAEAIAISGLERLVQALETRLRRCEERHDQRDVDDARRDELISQLQEQVEAYERKK